MVNILTFDLNLLRVLDALLAEGSATRAGQRLGLSQPAVSAALQRLRQSLDDDLFVRAGQGLKPTDFALSLETPVRQVFDQLEVALNGPARFNPASATDTFRISGSDYWAEMLMPRLARKLSVTAPNMRVQLVNLVAGRQTESLAQRQVDIVIAPAVDVPDWIERAPVAQADFTVIASRNNAHVQAAQIAEGTVFPVDVYSALGHVIFSPEGRSATDSDLTLGEAGVNRHVAMTLPTFSSIFSTVEASDFIAMAPWPLVERAVTNMEISWYKPPVELTPRLLDMTWHKRSSTNPAHAWLRQNITDVLKNL